MSRKTWIAALACGLVVLVVGALAIHFAGGSDSAQQAHRVAQRATDYGQQNLGIPYGTSQREVLRKLGAPTAKRANCWVYRGRVGTVRGRSSGRYVDALEYCFAEGPTGGQAVSRILSHMPVHTIVMRDPVTYKVHKTTFPASWGATMALAPVPQWYLQQSS